MNVEAITLKQFRFSLLSAMICVLVLGGTGCLWLATPASHPLPLSGALPVMIVIFATLSSNAMRRAHRLGPVAIDKLLAEEWHQHTIHRSILMALMAAIAAPVLLSFPISTSTLMHPVAFMTCASVTAAACAFLACLIWLDRE